jgi:hypothetical protein
MEFWKVIRALIRRKVLIFPLLVTAIMLGISGYFLTPLKYQSSATMVLVTPAFGGTLSQDPAHPTDLTNPLLNFNDNLKTASAILIHAMNTRDVAAGLGALDGPTSVTIDDGRTSPDLILNSGPFVYIAGESTSSAQARDVVMRAQKRIRQELVERQKELGAPPETYITLDDVVPPADPEPTRSDRIKVGGGAFALSLLMGLSAAYAWQRLGAERPRGNPDNRQVQPEKPDSNWSWALDLSSTGPGVQDSALHEPGPVTIPQLADDDQLGEDMRAAQPGGASSPRIPNTPAPGDPVPDGEQARVEQDSPQPGGASSPRIPNTPAPGDPVADSDQVRVEQDSPQPGTDNSALTASVDVTEEKNVQEENQARVVETGNDEPSSGGPEQTAEPAQVAYDEHEQETTVHWRLYLVDYPPGNGEHAASQPVDDEFDWDKGLASLSDGISTVTGRSEQRQS